MGCSSSCSSCFTLVIRWRGSRGLIDKVLSTAGGSRRTCMAAFAGRNAGSKHISKVGGDHQCMFQGKQPCHCSKTSILDWQQSNGCRREVHAGKQTGNLRPAWFCQSSMGGATDLRCRGCISCCPSVLMCAL